jgi:membrane protease YdiL (CAAX protease family)
MWLLIVFLGSLFLLFYLSLRKRKAEALVYDEKLELALSTFPMVGLWTLGIIAISLLLEAGSSLFPGYFDELTTTLLLSEISVIFLLVLIYRAVRRQKGLKLLEVLGLETKGLGFVKVWVFPAIFAFGYAALSSMILDARPIQPMTPLQELLESANSLWVLLFFVGTAILSAPFFEEVIFRGFLFYVLRPFKGVVFAVIFVALLFAAMHVDQYWGDWAAIAVVGLFGLALTLMRAVTGSAVPGMVAHYVYNTSLVVLPVVMVIVSNPTYFDYQMNYYRLNEAQKEERLLVSINQNPKFANSYNDLAWLYSDQGIKLDQALELINKALELEPRNYAFLDTKAEVLFKMQRVAEAVAIEEDLIKKYPQDSYLQDQLKKFQGLAPANKAADSKI